MTSQHQVTWYRVTSQSVWVCCRRQQWRHRFLCSKLGSVSIAWRSFMKSSVLGATQSEPEKHKNNKGEIYLEMLICLLSTASCDKTYVICSKCVEEWIASNVRWRHVRRRWPWPVRRCKRCWGTCWEVWFVVGREIDHCKRRTYQWIWLRHYIRKHMLRLNQSPLGGSWGLLLIGGGCFLPGWLAEGCRLTCRTCWSLRRRACALLACGDVTAL